MEREKIHQPPDFTVLSHDLRTWMVAGIFFRSAVMSCQVTMPTGACSPLNPNDVMLDALKSLRVNM